MGADEAKIMKFTGRRTWDRGPKEVFGPVDAESDPLY